MATEIKYNGSVIASPEAGQTATLKCQGMKMETDLVVSVPAEIGDIPDGYIKPSGTLTITENGTYDITEFVGVSVNVPSEVVEEYDGTITVV